MKRLVVEKDKLRNNINTIKRMVQPNVKIIAVLKGNGYGLDIIQYGQFLLDNGIDFFAVSEVEEAVLLRDKGFENDILLLSATAIEQDMEQVVRYNIIPAVGSETSVLLVNDIAKKMDKIVDVHLKIDTGFGRFGFLPKDVERLCELLKTLDHIRVAGTFSHLSFSFAKKEKDVRVQFDQFSKCIELLKANGIEPGLTHIANSCGFLRYKDMHLDAIRVGSAFLGRLPIDNTYGLDRIAYLKSNIIEIKQLPAKHYIGYANTYKTIKETTIAIVPVGYKDGYGIEKSRDTFRFIDILRYMYHDLKLLLGDRGMYVKVNGQKAKILGRVSMYNIIVDITNIDANIGDEVILDVNPILVESTIKREYV